MYLWKSIHYQPGIVETVTVNNINIYLLLQSHYQPGIVYKHQVCLSQPSLYSRSYSEFYLQMLTLLFYLEQMKIVWELDFSVILLQTCYWREDEAHVT